MFSLNKLEHLNPIVSLYSQKFCNCVNVSHVLNTTNLINIIQYIHDPGVMRCEEKLNSCVFKENNDDPIIFRQESEAVCFELK